jgi:hypothetical protein
MDTNLSNIDKVLDNGCSSSRILFAEHSVRNPVCHLQPHQYTFDHLTVCHTLFVTVITLLILSGPAGAESFDRAIHSLCLILKKSSLSMIVNWRASSSGSMSNSLIFTVFRGRIEGGGKSEVVVGRCRFDSMPFFSYRRPSVNNPNTPAS